jgi:hypothetical protein
VRRGLHACSLNILECILRGLPVHDALSEGYYASLACHHPLGTTGEGKEEEEEEEEEEGSVAMLLSRQVDRYLDFCLKRLLGMKDKVLGIALVQTAWRLSGFMAGSDSDPLLISMG